MLYYHENECDEINLDKEPLLQLTNTNHHDDNEDDSYSNEETYSIANDISICIDEYYFNKYEIMSSENLESDKDGNVKFAIHTAKETYSSTTNRDLLSRQQHADISENLLGIFVVSFDTKLGNIVEWQIPENLNLERIEFKAMASGFHLIQNDVVYAKH